MSRRIDFSSAISLVKSSGKPSVVKFEDLDSRYDVFARLRYLLDYFFQLLQADRRHCRETLLFGLDHSRNVLTRVYEIGIGFLHPSTTYPESSYRKGSLRPSSVP